MKSLSDILTALRPFGLVSMVAFSALPVDAQAGGRVLTVDDVLQIKVVGQSDLDSSVRVETDGTINFPYAGRLKVVGRTQDQLAKILDEKLKAADVVKDPHVLVEIATFGAQATVQGAVGAPGAVTLDRSTTLTQVISRAGGLKDTAGEIVIKRPTKRGMAVYKYSARDMATGKLDATRVRIYNNDEVFVDALPFYYLYGFVNKSGQFPLFHDLTVQQALAAGGGVGPLGSDWRIRIKRTFPDGAISEIPASLDDIVQPNDTIIVNERIF